MAADRVTAALLVLGNGLSGSGLSPGSLARVRAAVDHPPVSRIVFTGGWEQARTGAPEPPEGCREADLMRRAAYEVGLPPDTDVRLECLSRSTLENFLHVRRDGLLDGLDLGPARPLGLVTHSWHLPRVRYLAGKVLGLRGRSLVDVPAYGPGRLCEYGIRAASRVCFLGVRDPAVLLRRERLLVTLMRRSANGV